MVGLDVLLVVKHEILHFVGRWLYIALLGTLLIILDGMHLQAVPLEHLILRV
jgi:hypothetical protein